MRLLRSRSGSGRTVPSRRTTQIRPSCETTNRRPEPSSGATIDRGWPGTFANSRSDTEIGGTDVGSFAVGPGVAVVAGVAEECAAADASGWVAMGGNVVAGCVWVTVGEHAANTITPTASTPRGPRRPPIAGTVASGRGTGPVLGCRAVEAFELADLLRVQGESGRLYHEFIRTHDLSVGLYVLPAGGTDPQGPHTEDEVYHVISGLATITVGAEEHVVSSGSTIFVGADVPHRFHDIEDELVVLVFFGPAEYTHRTEHSAGRPHGAAAG